MTYGMIGIFGSLRQTLFIKKIYIQLLLFDEKSLKAVQEKSQSQNIAYQWH